MTTEDRVAKLEGQIDKLQKQQADLRKRDGQVISPRDSSASGVLVAFYYGATGIAWAWAFRKVMLKNAGFFFAGVLFPFLSGLFCFWVGYEVIKQAGTSASGVLIAMAIGIPLILIARKTTRSDFFRRPTIAYDTIEPAEAS